jgi:hypothetical protein
MLKKVLPDEVAGPQSYIDLRRTIWALDVPVPVKLIALAIIEHMKPGRMTAWPSRERLALMCRMPMRTFDRHFPAARELFAYEHRDGKTMMFRAKVLDAAAEIVLLWPERKNDGSAKLAEGDGSAKLAEGQNDGSANLAETGVRQFGRGGSANLAEGGSANLADRRDYEETMKRSFEEVNRTHTQSVCEEGTSLSRRKTLVDRAANSENEQRLTDNSKNEQRLTDDVDNSKNELHVPLPNEHMDKRVQDAAFAYYRSRAEEAGLRQVPRTLGRAGSVRRRGIATCIRECGGLQGWREAVDRIMRSSWLTGKTSDWQVDLDWLFRGRNLEKVLEGKYDSRGGAESGSKSRFVVECEDGEVVNFS